jgi:hypothetical protein
MKSACTIDRRYHPSAEGNRKSHIVAENHSSSTAINNPFNTGSRGVFLSVAMILPCWHC